MMADLLSFDERYPIDPSLLEQAQTGLKNGAQSQIDVAKWIFNGMNGPAPQIYAGGPTYPLQAKDLRSYADKNQLANQRALVNAIRGGQ
jgi:hypothetical protein